MIAAGDDREKCVTHNL